MIALYYSKHHAAERWNLELGSNIKDKFQNSLKKLKTHEARIYITKTNTGVADEHFGEVPSKD